MASDVDICNMALAYIGDRASVSSINPAEASVQAQHCARFYPQARDQLLERFDWSFATTQTPLTELSSPPPGWLYRYALPSDCLKPRLVLPSDPPAALPDAYAYTWGYDIQLLLLYYINNQGGRIRYVLETDSKGRVTLLTNETQARLLYLARVTNASRFTPLFVEALARLLASMLAGPIIKGMDGMKVQGALRQHFEQVALPAAMASDANADNNPVQHTPSWILNR